MLGSDLQFTIQAHRSGIRPTTKDAKPLLISTQSIHHSTPSMALGLKVHQWPLIYLNFLWIKFEKISLGTRLADKTMRLTEYVHLCLETRLKNGDSVLDATAGNGYDTLKAAELVQPNGNVVAIDIQKQAIEATEAKLTEAKLNHLCELHLGNHGERSKH